MYKQGFILLQFQNDYTQYEALKVHLFYFQLSKIHVCVAHTILWFYIFTLQV